METGTMSRVTGTNVSIYFSCNHLGNYWAWISFERLCVVTKGTPKSGLDAFITPFKPFWCLLVWMVLDRATLAILRSRSEDCLKLPDYVALPCMEKGA